MGSRNESQNLAFAHQRAQKVLAGECRGRVYAGNGYPVRRQLPARGVQLDCEALVANQTAHGALLGMGALNIETKPGESKRVVVGEAVAAL